MRDRDLALEMRLASAIKYQLVFECPEFASLVEVDVNTHAAALGDFEEPVELAYGVAIDRSRVDATDHRRPGRGRLVKQLQHPGPPDHAVLRERDDLDLYRTIEGGSRFPHHLNAAMFDPEIYVDVRASGGGALPQELAKLRGRARNAWAAVPAPLRALVRNPTLDAWFSAIRHPRLPPTLVDVCVRVDEPRQGEQATSIDAPSDRISGAGNRHVGDHSINDL
jgi:hypothetical protein